MKVALLTLLAIVTPAGVAFFIVAYGIESEIAAVALTALGLAIALLLLRMTDRK